MSGQLSAHFSADLDAARAGHTQVEEEHVRIRLGATGDRTVAVACLPDHRDIRLRLKQFPERVSDEFVVIGYEDGYRGPVHQYPPSSAQR